MATETNFDPFEDESTAESETPEAEAPEEKPEADAEGEADGSKDETGEEETTEPPSEEKDKSAKPEKMIPESRLKAALKDYEAKLDAANQELSQFKASPVPDKDKDPEGYNLHLRMETSKAVMREFATDYDDVIKHYAEMAESNPYLNEAVAKHPIPAKYAYDIAKKDMEIRELSALKTSDEWKQFQEFKKQQAAQSAANENSKASSAVTKALTSKVPNLNRATDVSSKGKSKVSDDDELFAGAL